MRDRDRDHDSVAARFQRVRQHSLMLAEPLSDEDCGAQSMSDASPVKWHLAHTTWFFETFILERYESEFVAFHPAFRMLFNSYYNGIGERHPRAQRGLLTRPSMDEVRAYRANVDARMLALLGGHDGAELATLVELGCQHEQQHQELILTDVKHLLAHNAMYPVYSAAAPAPRATGAQSRWVRFDGGLVDIGHRGDGFCFDNELPRHRQYVAPFALASQLVTNGEYLAFMDAGGYADASLWLAEGWDCVRSQGLVHPLYWELDASGAWQQFTLQGLQRIDMQAPVTHLSLYEAAAFAQWSGARLPTEAEWELAATPHDGMANGAIDQLYDHCWQWTSSSYAPYPGYASAPGALGEYNGKFMLNQYVLRGSSCATSAGHARASYRNFFPAGARWQFSGVRLAR